MADFSDDDMNDMDTADAGSSSSSQPSQRVVAGTSVHCVIMEVCAPLKSLKRKTEQHIKNFVGAVKSRYLDLRSEETYHELWKQIIETALHYTLVNMNQNPLKESGDCLSSVFTVVAKNDETLGSSDVSSPALTPQLVDLTLRNLHEMFRIIDDFTTHVNTWKRLSGVLKHLLDHPLYRAYIHSGSSVREGNSKKRSICTLLLVQFSITLTSDLNPDRRILECYHGLLKVSQAEISMDAGRVDEHNALCADLTKFAAHHVKDPPSEFGAIFEFAKVINTFSMEMLQHSRTQFLKFVEDVIPSLGAMKSSAERTPKNLYASKIVLEVLYFFKLALLAHPSETVWTKIHAQCERPDIANINQLLDHCQNDDVSTFS